MNKPPIGVMPERIWNDKYPYPSRDDVADRVQALEAALWRFYETGYSTFNRALYVSWLHELTNRREQLENW